MNAYLRFFLTIILVLACLSCLTVSLAEDNIRIVTTIFPIYDWTREVLGEDAPHADLTLLLDSGIDLHSYQPSAQDIFKISAADLFIYVGGESDAWVEDVLKTAINPNLKVINLVDAMGDDIKTEELVEGMEQDEDEDKDEDEEEADEHVWLSLRNAEKLVMCISETLGEIDPANKDHYAENASQYISKLSALDAQYTGVISTAAFNTMLFGDRFPFRYLADDYALSYYAAFSGCSAESEASFKTIIFLAGKMDELSLPAVLTIENPKTRIAETIVENTAAKNQKILSMNSMQSTTSQDIENGETYLSIMEDNLSVLKEALN
ncbi:MAG: zinc ABC transporter substrate-binding protein [Clostridia bacterium]|nr:zinc ABC transporter substrate-binding protein [Clostridia bacterium]